jgi:hypothetical protein
MGRKPSAIREDGSARPAGGRRAKCSRARFDDLSVGGCFDDWPGE